MIDKKSEYLELPLSNEQNMLEDDCPRIVEAFKKVDAHARRRMTGLTGWKAGRILLKAAHRRWKRRKPPRREPCKVMRRPVFSCHGKGGRDGACG